MPTLIEHVDDNRLTKTYRGQLNNFRGFHYRISDVVTEILLDIAGNELHAWRLRGDTLGKANVQAWWAEASKVGEKAYGEPRPRRQGVPLARRADA